MSLFFVRWEINIEAGNALEAARQAREIQTRPGTTAVVFDVWAGYQPRGVSITVDLDDVAPAPSLEQLARRMLDYEAHAFEHDEPVDGGDMVEAFASWRAELKALLDG